MTRTKTDNLVILIICVVFIASLFLLDKFRAVAIGVSLGSLYANLAAQWDSRHQKWLWISLAVLAAIHIVAIWWLDLTVPEGPSLSYIVPAAFADGFAMFGVLELVEYLVKRRK